MEAVLILSGFAIGLAFALWFFLTTAAYTNKRKLQKIIDRRRDRGFSASFSFEIDIEDDEEDKKDVCH